jgi:cardiolipin synthase
MPPYPDPDQAPVDGTEAGTGAAQGPAPGEDRILTVPNVITLVRLACLPVFVWLLLGLENQSGAAALLAALGATDWVDGYIARHFHQVSTLGKVLDPVADRLLFFTAIVAIIISGDAPLWFCIAVLVREVLVAGTTLVLAALGARRIDVTWFGKAGTFGLMFAFPLFVAGNGDVGPTGFLTFAAWCFGLVGLVLSYYAAALYVPIARSALREGRAARGAGSSS